jgi:hypothetical protein
MDADKLALFREHWLVIHVGYVPAGILQCKGWKRKTWGGGDVETVIMSSTVFDNLLGVMDTDVFALAQVISPNEDYDCGVITAFHPKYTKDENAKRHKSLHAKLLMAGCSLASVTGNYVTGNGIALKKKALLAVRV